MSRVRSVSVHVATNLGSRAPPCPNERGDGRGPERFVDRALLRGNVPASAAARPIAPPRCERGYHAQSQNWKLSLRAIDRDEVEQPCSGYVHSPSYCSDT